VSREGLIYGTVAVLYGVLWQDWGNEDHVFMPVSGLLLYALGLRGVECGDVDHWMLIRSGRYVTGSKKRRKAFGRYLHGRARSLEKLGIRRQLPLPPRTDGSNERTASMGWCTIPVWWLLRVEVGMLSRHVQYQNQALIPNAS
jgi:hypothetical protein